MVKFFAACLLSVISISTIAADYGHIHLAAPNAEQAAEWYAKHFGGKTAGFLGATGEGVEIDRAYFDGISVIFFQREPGEGSVGSGVDHIGFSMPEIENKIKALVNDGAIQIGETQAFRGMTVAYVTDPWGTKVELIDDSDLRGLHHIHLASANPLATLDWYHQNLGGERAQYAAVLPGLLFNSKVWLFSLPAKDVAPTQGRSLDHLGWNFSNLDEAAKTLKSADVKFTMEPRDYRGIRIGFIEGPDGVRIELVQP